MSIFAVQTNPNDDTAGRRKARKGYAKGGGAEA